MKGIKGIKDIKFKNIEDIKEFTNKLKGQNKESKHTYKDFNFFEPYIENQKNKKNRELYAVVIPTVLIFFMIASFAWNYIFIKSTKKEITEMNKTINSSQSKAKLQQAEKLNKKHNILQKYNDQVQNIGTTIDKKQVVSKELMAKISSALPKTISFKTISIDGEGLQIQGVAGQRVNVAEFQYNLKQINKIGDAQVITINEESNSADEVNTGCTFTLKCTLKDVGENEN